MTRGHALALALALGLGAAPGVASAYCRTTTSARQPDPVVCPNEGLPIAWTGGCTGLRVNPAVRAPGIPVDQLRVVVEEATRAWKTIACDPATRAAPSFELVLQDDTTALVGYDAMRPNTNVVTFRAVWGDDAFHDPNAAAITIVTFGSRSASILDADTELNIQARFPYSLDGGPSTTDLRTVVTHELGHTLGLAHTPDRNAVMWYTAGRGERRRTPNADDVQGVCAVYPPGRAVRCDPDARSEGVEGGGATCAARPRGGYGVGLACAALALAALAVSRRRAPRS